MKSIQEIVNDKVKAMVEDGSLQQCLEDGVQKAIEKAISNQFASFGNLTKQIEGAIEKGLAINPDDLPFESYNAQMLVAIKGRLGSMFQGEAAARFMAEMDKVLSPAPKEMTINKFVETVVGFWKADEWSDKSDMDEDATVKLEERDFGGWYLSMWKRKSGSNSSDLHLYITGNNQIRINHRHCYNPTCFQEHEAFVFKLYAAGTVLTGLETFDPYDCDLSLVDYS